jgi:hypothetical protein
MGFVQGIGEIRKGFRDVEENFQNDSWIIPKKISDSWVYMIHITDAIDTGDMLRAVNWHPQATAGDLKQWTVDTLTDNPEVDYPGFVEGGTKFMEARYPAQKGIEREDFAQSITDMVDRGFSNAR